MVTDKKNDVFNIVWYGMLSKVQFWHHQTTGTKSELIESISKWLTVDFDIEWAKWVWIDP